MPRIQGQPPRSPSHLIGWSIKLGIGLLLIAILLVPVLLKSRYDNQATDAALPVQPQRSAPATAARPIVTQVADTSPPATEPSTPLPALTPAAQPWRAPVGRSPIPQPGESIKKPLPPRRLVAKSSALPAPTQPILWGEAHRYVGHHLTVEGRIVNTNNIGSVCFLNFHHDWRNTFYIVVFDDAYDGFPAPPQDHFLNQRIQVTGKVTLHKGRPQVQVHTAAQIKIIPSKSE